MAKYGRKFISINFNVKRHLTMVYCYTPLHFSDFPRKGHEDGFGFFKTNGICLHANSSSRTCKRSLSNSTYVLVY